MIPFGSPSSSTTTFGMTTCGGGLEALNAGGAADIAGGLLAGMIRIRSYDEVPAVPDRGLAI
jgi:hypothetical protein